MRRSSVIAIAGSVAVLAVAVGAGSVLFERSEAALRAGAALTGGDPKHGRLLLTQYGCTACHTIPGVYSASGMVGPPLDGIGSRVYIAGVLTNTPANLMRWIQDPQGVDSLTAMPDTGVTDSDVRDIAAYLYSLR